MRSGLFSSLWIASMFILFSCATSLGQKTESAVVMLNAGQFQNIAGKIIIKE
jgi:hypothetical protein